MKKVVALIISIVCLISSIGILSFAGKSEVSKGAIIYQENFDEIADGELPEGFTVTSKLATSGSAKVQDGKLVIDATNVEIGKVLLPEKLNDYGDYMIEADVRFVSSKDNNRWTSIAFRQQETDENFYHMCMRRNTKATNGVEFARRTPGVWSVAKTGSAEVAIDTNFTHVKVAISGGTVYEYIEDEAVVKCYQLDDSTNYLKKGGIGLIANYSVVEYDNIVISTCTIDTKSAVNENYVAYNLQDTSVVASAASVATVDTLAELEAKLLETNRANNVILKVNDEGNVTNLDGITFEEAIAKVKGTMLPVIEIESESARDKVVTYLRSIKFYDVIILSSNKDLVSTVRNKMKNVVGAIDFTSITDMSTESLDSMVYGANENSAKVVVISGAVATKAAVEYMQHRLITVWVTLESSELATIHHIIQTGANGIVTKNIKELADAYSLYAEDQNVLVRNPLSIGHRGLPSVAPENSLESAIEAVNAGVDVIELDVRYSKDGEIIIYHEDDLSSLTTGSGKISSKTLDEIKKFDLTKSVSYGKFSAYPAVKVATLKEFFEEFKNDDVMFFIEFKEDNSKLNKAVCQLITEYNMKNRVAFISFYGNQLTQVSKNLPGASVGLLSSLSSSGSTEDTIESVMKSIGYYNSTLNFGNVNSKTLVTKLMYRGITTYPWTYNFSSTKSAYLMGAGGITTDSCNDLSNVATAVTVGERNEYLVRPEKSVTLTPTATTRTGEFTESEPTMVIIDGAENISVDGNTITGVKNGTAHIMYKVVGNIGNEYTIYSDVITITVDESAPLETPAPLATGCKSYISCGVAVCTLLGLVMIRRKKNG